MIINRLQDNDFVSGKLVQSWIRFVNRKQDLHPPTWRTACEKKKYILCIVFLRIAPKPLTITAGSTAAFSATGHKP